MQATRTNSQVRSRSPASRLLRNPIHPPSPTPGRMSRNAPLFILFPESRPTNEYPTPALPLAGEGDWPPNTESNAPSPFQGEGRGGVARRGRASLKVSAAYGPPPLLPGVSHQHSWCYVGFDQPGLIGSGIKVDYQRIIGTKCGASLRVCRRAPKLHIVRTREHYLIDRRTRAALLDN